MTLIPFFVKVNPVISHLHLSNGPSKTNLGSQRYLSEINEPWPLRPMVELQGRASFLFLRLSEESMYLSRTLSPTFMKVTSARTRVIPLSSVKYTWRKGQKESLLGMKSRYLSAAPSIGVILYSSSVTSNIQTFDSDFNQKVISYESNIQTRSSCWPQAPLLSLKVHPCEWSWGITCPLFTHMRQWKIKGWGQGLRGPRCHKIGHHSQGSRSLVAKLIKSCPS